jgi:hypothetical protein
VHLAAQLAGSADGLPMTLSFFLITTQERRKIN